MESSTPPPLPRRAAATPAPPVVARTEQERDELIRSLLPLVNHVVARMGLYLPPHIAQDDLISAGVMGLLDAVDRYDPSRGTTLKTYCSFRIRGQILDELRRLDWVPRSVHKDARTLEAAQEAASQRLGREPTEDELAKELGISVKDLLELLDRIRPATYFSLQEPVFNSDEGDSLSHEDVVPDPNSPTPFASLLNEEDKVILRRTMEKLPVQQLHVLTLYYMENLRLKDIAAVLDITESRVSQVHTLAITRLRSTFLRERKR
ncbi:MAG TPA: FliA/WhiG family RNA polymerase sigma factor [Candidatus Methylacidiphilales bacterium]